MTWMEGVLEAFKFGVQAKTARDQRKASEQLLADQRAAESAARAATDENARKAFEAQASAAKMAYASLSQPGAISSGGPSVSSMDAFLPYLVVLAIGLVALSMLKR